MRIIVTGDRNWECVELAGDVLQRLLRRYGEVVIVHGGARGVDESFALACDALDVADEPHPADWATHGRRAGPTRNQEMADAGAAMCLAFHRDLMASKGTKDIVRRAIKAGIPTYVCSDETASPVRVAGV